MTDDGANPRRRPAPDEGPTDGPGGPDRRSVLRRSAATAAALGTPLLGACTETPGTTDGTDDGPATEAAAAVEEHARPEQVEAAVAANEGLFAALGELGVPGPALPEGLRVTAYRVDGELVPEQRLYRATAVGVLTVVLSPEGAPFGPHADVVTGPEMMADAPVEWPDGRGSELPDGRRVFRVDDAGWTEPGFGEAVAAEEIPTAEELCGSGSSDPREWECTGPSSDDECAYVTCCGHVEIIDPSECPGIGGGDTVRFDPCEVAETGCRACWRSTNGCECVELPHVNC